MTAFSPEELTFVQAQRVARLATVDASGQPHVVPVCFVYLDGCIYIAIDEKPKHTTRLKRVRNIEGNPRVSVVFDRYEDDWTKLVWVMVQASASILDSGAEYAAALAALREKYEQYRSMALEGRPVIRVTPDRVSSWGAL